jgi:hypothetical protein
MVLEVLPKFMTTLLVLLMDKGIHASEHACTSLVLLHRLFLALCDHFPSLQEAVERKLDLFVKSERGRVKSSSPLLRNPEWKAQMRALETGQVYVPKDNELNAVASSTFESPKDVPPLSSLSTATSTTAVASDATGLTLPSSLESKIPEVDTTSAACAEPAFQDTSALAKQPSSGGLKTKNAECGIEGGNQNSSGAGKYIVPHQRMTSQQRKKARRKEKKRLQKLMATKERKLKKEQEKQAWIAARKAGTLREYYAAKAIAKAIKEAETLPQAKKRTGVRPATTRTTGVSPSPSATYPLPSAVAQQDRKDGAKRERKRASTAARKNAVTQPSSGSQPQFTAQKGASTALTVLPHRSGKQMVLAAATKWM